METKIKDIHCIVFTEDKYSIVEEQFEAIFNRDDS